MISSLKAPSAGLSWWHIIRLGLIQTSLGGIVVLTTSTLNRIMVVELALVTEGDVVETVFKVTNSGKTDLIITDAQVTCGCTVPVWPKAPIKPGQTEDIKVKFNTSGKTNRQQKNITLITNTESGREILTLKGMVSPKEN